ncbi:ABC transporter substrate-binding protein [Butyrivibrio sp. AE3004]|uniref:ABC transporter substrate-binding protein n=1 Tax=Butyrivibrio sp. AE3004 TaxID=1506994 RepID=UPI0018CC339F|nr:ABC transporter substrate-binding protein [Butyrivibrio sp. AE3004]
MMILAGCAKKQDSGSEGIVNLRWVTYSGGSIPLDAKKVIAAANKVSAEKIRVTVDLEFQPSDKINLMMASGEYYDMVFTSSWVNDFDKNASAGCFLDITDLVEKETPELYKTIGKYWECAKINDRIYGIPTLKDMGAEEMFRMNSDYFEGQKGMIIPERMTFGELEPYLEAYKKDFPDKYPLAMDKSGFPGYLNCVERIVDGIIVIPYDTEDGDVKAVPLWECDELTNKYRTLHRWYTKGYIHPDAATIQSTSADKSIPVRGGVAWRGYQGYSNPEQWGFNVKTSIYEGPYLSRSSEQGAMFSICAACPEEKAVACLKYMELLNTDQKFRDILGYGIEGTHFEYLENGTVLRLQEGSDRYNLGLYQTGSSVNASVESVSRTFLADPDQWAQVYKGYDEEGIYSKANGFAYNPGSNEDIITAIRAIYSDYSTELCTGTSDPDVVLPQMKKRMEAAGINELLDDVNRQLDIWESKNQ